MGLLVEEIVTGMGLAIGFIWGLFEDFLGLISTEPLMYVPIALAILFAAVMLVVKIIRRFGVKPR